MTEQRPPKTFRALLLRSAEQTHAWALGGLGVLLTGAAWVFPTGFVLPFPTALLLCISFALIAATLLRAAFVAFELMRHPLPVVRSARPAPSSYAGLAVCFLEPSDLFAQGSLVSFWVLDEGFEVFFGLGEVLIVQHDGFIQTGLWEIAPEHKDLLAALRNNDATLLRRLLVKPTIPRLPEAIRQDSQP